MLEIKPPGRLATDQAGGITFKDAVSNKRPPSESQAASRRSLQDAYAALPFPDAHIIRYLLAQGIDADSLTTNPPRMARVVFEGAGFRFEALGQCALIFKAEVAG